MQKHHVIEFFDGKQINVAKALNVSKGAVSQWGRIIPEPQAMKLERLTGGALVYDPGLYEKTATNDDQSIAMAANQ